MGLALSSFKFWFGHNVVDGVLEPSTPEPRPLFDAGVQPELYRDLELRDQEEISQHEIYRAFYDQLYPDQEPSQEDLALDRLLNGSNPPASKVEAHKNNPVNFLKKLFGIKRPVDPVPNVTLTAGARARTCPEEQGPLTSSPIPNNEDTEPQPKSTLERYNPHAEDEELTSQVEALSGFMLERRASEISWEVARIRKSDGAGDSRRRSGELKRKQGESAGGETGESKGAAAAKSSRLAICPWAREPPELDSISEREEGSGSSSGRGDRWHLPSRKEDWEEDEEDVKEWGEDSDADREVEKVFKDDGANVSDEVSPSGGFVLVEEGDQKVPPTEPLESKDAIKEEADKKDETEEGWEDCLAVQMGMMKSPRRSR